MINPVYSQEINPADSTPPPLPAPSEGVNAGLIINSVNAPDFRSQIVPELYPLVRSKLFVMDGVSGLRLDLSSLFSIAPGEGAKDEDILQPNGTLKDGYKIKEGLPFPGWQDEKDNKIKAQKIIWNMQAQFWSYKIFQSDFTISYIEDAKLGKQLKGNWLRAYPGVVNPDDKSIQLFRELLQFNNPTILKPLKYLTFRFFGNEEDMLWFSSPSLKKVREITGSNRADSILDSAFSLDDFLGWSGKSELSEIVYDKEMTALVPFSSYETKVMDVNDDKCDIHHKVHNPTNSARWNYLSHRFPDAFAWLPTDAVFTPRKIIRLELVPKDPFSIYGRQILYIDKELMIPYYKFVFNRAGYLWKTVFNIPSFFLSKDKTRNYIFTDYLLVEDRQSKGANVVEFDNIEFCKTYNDKIKLSNFDPLKLVPAVSPTAVPAKSK